MKDPKTVAVIALLGAGLLATSASAQSWGANHPRRVEANGRLATQNARIRNGVASGRLDLAQAHQLHADDRSIRGEERADAAVHGGHITRAEKGQINRQENANSRAIYGEKH